MPVRKTSCHNSYYLNIFLSSNIILFLLLTKSSQALENYCSYHAEVNRKIDSIGFHRNVYYNFTLNTNCTVNSCKLCLQETIPPGLFVNKDQLTDLLRLERLSATVDGEVDIEAPARDSPTLILRLFKDLSLSATNTLIGNATVPVHLRYHEPQPGGGFRKFTFGQPDVYIYCAGIPLYHSEGVFLTQCAGNDKDPLPYRKINTYMSDGDTNLVVEVPVGDSDITDIVYAGTYGVAIAGSLYLAGVLIKI